MAALTSVAAGVGMAVTAGTTGMSFIQAGKQRKMQRQAEAEAEKAMAEARKKLEVNYYEQLGIQKEPYELQREALLQQGAMGVEAGREGDVRGAAATVGRVQMAQQEAQAGIRSAMGQELTDLSKLTAAEESRLRDVGVGLDLEEVAGAQLAAANAQEMQAQAVQQGMQGITSLGQQAVEAIPLFGKTKTPTTAPPPVTSGPKTQYGMTGPQEVGYMGPQIQLAPNRVPSRPAQFGVPYLPGGMQNISSVNWLDYLRPR